MRFMMIVIPKGYESAAPDAMPSAEAVAKMTEYNKSLQQAGSCLRWMGSFRLLQGRGFRTWTAKPQ